MLTQEKIYEVATALMRYSNPNSERSILIEVAYTARLVSSVAPGVWATITAQDVIGYSARLAKDPVGSVDGVLNELAESGILQKSSEVSGGFDFTEHFLRYIGEDLKVRSYKQASGTLIYDEVKSSLLEVNIKVKGQEAELKDLYFFYKNMQWFFETQPEIEHIYVGRAKLNKKEAEELHLVLSQQSAFL